MIRVRLIASGETIEIQESDFDEALHERLAADPPADPPAARTIGDMPVDEFFEGMGQAMATGLASAGAGQPARSPAAPPAPTQRAPARVSPAWEHQYRGLPAWERELRTPESDHEIHRWARALVNRDEATLREIEANDPQTRAALAEGAAATGGNLVPTPLASLIVEKRTRAEVIGPRAQTFTSDAETLSVPTEAVLMVASGTAEAGTISEDDPTFGQLTLTKKKATAATRSSIELLEDNAFNLVSVISRQAGNAFALYNDAQDAADGDDTGTNQTDAIHENASITEVDGTVGALAYTDVTALFYGLAAMYRSMAYWLAPNSVIQSLANLVDGNGRPIFVDAGSAAQPLTGGNGAPGVGMILGRPVLESAGCPSGSLAFGSLEHYGVLQGGAIRVEASSDAAFLADQIVWKFVQRRDGAVLLPEAFVKSNGIS